MTHQISGNSKHRRHVVLPRQVATLAERVQKQSSQIDEAVKANAKAIAAIEGKANSGTA